MTQWTPPTYGNAPLNEVVYGISFEELGGLKAPHLGLYWNLIKSEFPDCEHATPLFTSDLASNFAFTKLPRTWFIHSKGNDLIQIQQDRFLFNWRKLDASDAYPGNKYVADAFKKYLTQFKSFVDEQNIGLIKYKGCELSYINHIFSGQGWDALSDLNNVFPDLNWRKTERFLKEPLGFSCSFVCPLNNDQGELLVKIQQATITDDPMKTPLLVFELTARINNVLSSEQEMWDWFEMAHEWVIRGFMDLTSGDIQKNYWRKI